MYCQKAIVLEESFSMITPSSLLVAFSERRGEEKLIDARLKIAYYMRVL